MPHPPSAPPGFLRFPITTLYTVNNKQKTTTKQQNVENSLHEKPKTIILTRGVRFMCWPQQGPAGLWRYGRWAL